ncbi:MAG: hypothetical protein WCI27_03250 [Candidatus Omnitrophota bacterium]
MGYLKGVALKRIISEIEKWNRYPYWKNVHGLTEFQYCDRLFRVEAFEDFKKNVENNRLFFRHPDKWLKDDKLDSILLRLKVVLPDGTEVFQGYYSEIFCQCWSTADSKEMWEKYGKDHRMGYIKMVASLDSLMRAFDNTTEFKGYSESFAAGAVNYSNFDESTLTIKLNSKSECIAFFNQKVISQLYLEKRSSYGFENEVRFLSLNQKDQRGRDYAYVQVRKPLNQVLQGIIIDSRLKDEILREKIEKFASTNGIKVI